MCPVQCSTVQCQTYSTVLYSTVQCCTVQCRTCSTVLYMQYSIVQYSAVHAVQYSTVQCRTCSTAPLLFSEHIVVGGGGQYGYWPPEILYRRYCASDTILEILYWRYCTGDTLPETLYKIYSTGDIQCTRVVVKILGCLGTNYTGSPLFSRIIKKNFKT